MAASAASNDLSTLALEPAATASPLPPPGVLGEEPKDDDHGNMQCQPGIWRYVIMEIWTVTLHWLDINKEGAGTGNQVPSSFVESELAEK